MKKFEEVAKININEKLEKKGKFSYLSWAFAWAEIKKLDEKANYKVYENQDSLPFFKSEEGYFVKVGVIFNELEHIVFLPVLDGANKPIQKPNSFNINTSIQRCLVKAIAMHGLGLYVYAGEDLPEGAETDKKATINQIAYIKKLGIEADFDNLTFNQADQLTKGGRKA